jgi:peptidoglycan/xylan/chitin deacetylase (PgdA/CDA1 family)
MIKVRIVIITFLLCCSAQSWAQLKYLCITVDDLPTVTYGDNSIPLDYTITNGLIQAFKKYQIPAIGYVVEGQLYKNNKLDSSKIELLRMWLDNGFELGNHTYSHLDYNNVPDSIYFKDILKGGLITSELLKRYKDTLKYFRHPYLHTGITAQKSDILTEFLVMNQYVVSPVTIDNDDYLFAKAYHKAYSQKNDSLKKYIGRSYLEYMEKKLIYFEQKSQEVFHRRITQTLLIHASLINSDYMDELAAMYQRNGYTFVSQSKALEDKAYQEPITVYSRKGLSWIFRCGLSRGLSNELLTGDIETPNIIVNMANDK